MKKLKKCLVFAVLAVMCSLCAITTVKAATGEYWLASVHRTSGTIVKYLNNGFLSDTKPASANVTEINEASGVYSITLTDSKYSGTCEISFFEVAKVKCDHDFILNYSGKWYYNDGGNLWGWADKASSESSLEWAGNTLVLVDSSNTIVDIKAVAANGGSTGGTTTPVEPTPDPVEPTPEQDEIITYTKDYYLATVNKSLTVQYYFSNADYFTATENTNSKVTNLQYNVTKDVWSFNLGSITYEVVPGGKNVYPNFTVGNENTFLLKDSEGSYYDAYNQGKGAKLCSYTDLTSAQSYVNGTRDFAFILVDNKGNMLDLAGLTYTDLAYQVTTTNDAVRLIAKVNMSETELKAADVSYRLELDGKEVSQDILYYYTSVTNTDGVFDAFENTYYLVLYITGINKPAYAGKVLNWDVLINNATSKQVAIQL